MDDRYEEYSLPKEDTGFETYASSAPPCQKPVSRPRRNPWKTVAIALCCILLGSVAGAAVALTISRNKPPETAEVQPEMEVSYLLESRREAALEILPVDVTELLTPAQVYAENVNSTVGITTAITTNFWGYQTTSAASGSGFIISSDG